MKITIAIAAAIGIFVLMAFIVDGGRQTLTGEAASRKATIDAQFYQHQKDAYGKAAGQ